MDIFSKDQSTHSSRAKTICLSHDYPYPAQQVWDVAIDLDHLKTVSNGLVSFRNLPSGQLYQGQHIQVDVSLFGWMPYQPYEMAVSALDDERMSFLSSEVGAGVRSWSHSLRVIPQKNGCRILEQIEIDAGLATPIFTAWAIFLYRRRHSPRLRILTALAQGSKTNSDSKVH